MFDRIRAAIFGGRSSSGSGSRTGRTRSFVDMAWPSRDPARLAREGYQANATAFAAISLAGRTAAGVPWVLYEKQQGKGSRPKKFMSQATAMKAWATGNAMARKSVTLSEVEDHDALKFWENPNPRHSGQEFVEQWEISMLIAGVHFSELVVLPTTGKLQEMWSVQPQRMRIIPDDVDRVAGYAFIDADGKAVPFAPSEMMYTKFFNPLDELWGQSPLAAIANAIDTDNEAARWNWNLMKNSARPPGAFVTEQQIPDKRYEELKKEIAARMQGAKNAGRPLLLDGGLDWRTFALTAAELDWLNGRKLAKRDIYAGLAIGGELLSDPDSKTYASYKEAHKALYTIRTLPDLDKLKFRLNKDVLPHFGDNLYLDYDRDQIEALQEEQALLMDRMERATFLKVNEKRRATGYEDDPNGDVILVSAGMMRLEDAGMEGGGIVERPPRPEKTDPIKKAAEAVERMKALGEVA